MLDPSVVNRLKSFVFTFTGKWLRFEQCFRLALKETRFYQETILCRDKDTFEKTTKKVGKGDREEEEENRKRRSH